ncbi:hypothetical protein [Shewanella sp. 8A]|uniref:hypothetical protein n=1 Tax=Shewanella sp. 8A TaxID=2943323 RepID=UPI00201A78DD|nr:hypothetical protein [Shewanella sp. 8A]
MKKVLFRTKEAAEAQTGYFRVSSLMITSELAYKIYSYIISNKLITFAQPNQRKTCHNTYTLNFTLKQYHNNDHPKAYLSNPGAIGYYKKKVKTTRYRINPGTPESYISVHPPSDKSIQEFEALKARSPTLEQIYFWIVQKYPNDLLWMDYSMKPINPSRLITDAEDDK